MRFTLFAAAGLLAFSLAAHADLIAGSTDGGAVNGNHYEGQSFLVGGAGSYNNITFNFYSTTQTPYAIGGGYLFSTPYTGTPNGLYTATTGLVGAGAAANGFYTFGPNVILQSGVTYYFYETGYIPAGTILEGGDLVGGELYTASTANTAFSTFTDSQNFAVHGTAVATTPEPSSLALLSTGLLGVIGLVRKRFA